jgi:hypothetical protein
VPAELVFTGAEQAAMLAAIRAVPFPAPVRRRVEFFASHFEFAQHGGRRFEYRTKDAVTTSGNRVGEVIDANSGADREVDPGAQTLDGLSVRAMQTLIVYAKAMAWFRGEPEVSVADVAAILPFALRGKLLPNLDHPRFDVGAEHELTFDAVSWLGSLFDASNRQFDALGLSRDDPVGDLLAQFAQGLDGVSALEASGRITAIEAHIQTISATKKLYGRHFDDLTTLKYLHQRYTNYLRWAQEQAPS